MLTPVLLFLVAGCINFGLAGYAKFRLSDAMMIASRRCVAQGVATCGATAQALATARWQASAGVCNGGLRTTVVNSGNVITVTGTCAFKGGVMQTYLGMANLAVTTSAAMPY